MSICQTFCWKMVLEEAREITLFLKTKGEHLLIVEVYVDDIIFGATLENLCNEFSKMMRSEFEMSMMGEFNFFLGLQIKQTSNDTIIHQQKYIKELLRGLVWTHLSPLILLFLLQPS